MVVCALMVVGGIALKGQCLAGFDGRQYSRLCYNDIQPLYAARGVQAHVFPYVHGHLSTGDELAGGAIEYPVLTGVFMWASGLPVDSDRSYLVVSVLLLAPFAFATAYLLWRMAGRRALLWAGAPALVLYAFHNWDLLAVAAAVGGLWMWHRDRRLPAAVLFGIGAAFKMYPLLFLAPLFLEHVAERDLRAGLRNAGAGVATFFLINLPFVLVAPEGWFATYQFHSRRPPNFDSIWQFGWPSWSPERFNTVTTICLLVSFAAILGIGWVRMRRLGAYPFVQVCAALLAAFLLFNKVHSPQYTLWILPFFVLLNVNLLWWVAYAVVDLMVYVGVFRWFYDIVYRGEDLTFFKRLLIAGVWARAGVLLVLIAVFSLAKVAGGVARVTSRDRDPSHTVLRMSGVGDSPAGP